MKKYKTYNGSLCLIGCVQNYLKTNDCLIDECDILFQGNGFNLNYKKKENSISLKSDFYKSILEFCSKNNICFKKKNCNDKEEMLEIIKGSLKHKKDLLILQVYANDLKYSKSFTNRSNISHAVNILGIKEEDFFISDAYVPTNPSTTFDGFVNADLLLNSNTKEKHKYYILDNKSIETFQQNLEEKEMDELLRIEIIENLKKYINHDKCKDDCSGAVALYNFISDFRDYLDLFADDYTKIVLETSEKFFSYGFFSIRNILIKAISRISISHNDKNLLDVQSSLKEIYQKWFFIGRYLVKCALSQKQENLNELYDKSIDIYHSELELIGNLCKHA